MKTLSIVAILLLILAACAFGQDVTRPSATWHVQKYDLEVTLPQDSARAVNIRSVVSLQNVSGKPATTLTLRISPLADVAAVRINGAVAEYSKSEEKAGAVTLQRIAVRLPSIAPDGLARAAVDYKMTLKDNSALSSVSPTSAEFLPLSFWYPTPNSWFFARGGDTAPVRIKVNTAPGEMAVGAGSETGGAFEQKLSGQPFFVSGSWDLARPGSVSVYMPKGAGPEGEKRAGELASVFSDAVAFAATVFGKTPDAPLKIIASRRGAGFTSGGTVIVDEAVFRRPKIDSLTAMNIAEAAVKLWLGSAVSVDSEGYGVIGEGLSRFIATQFIESKYGKDVADVERVRQRTAYSTVAKRDAPLATVSPLDEFYYTETANKGAMIWRILAKRVGNTEFSNTLKANMQDGNLNLTELRQAFSAQKELVDYLFDQVTDMDLQVGLPQVNGTSATSALRNTGSVDVTVDVAATTDLGEKVIASSTIKAKSFGEITFNSNRKITRVEIDADKLYPQIDYSNDVAPRESTDSDPLLAAKKAFDKQDFSASEATGRTLLRDLPRFDELRILLGRAMLAENKNAEAEKEFKAVLDEKLPTARGIAWANAGLAEIASRSSQNAAALKFAETSIVADADFGASLAARNLRNKIGGGAAADASVKAYFAEFDKATMANRKADVDALVMPGEVTKFAGGVSGSTEHWQTQVNHVDRIDANTVLVEATVTVKLLNRSQESGMAVYRLTRFGSGWKMISVDMFEVR